jgi:hypothetical protein
VRQPTGSPLPVSIISLALQAPARFSLGGSNLCETDADLPRPGVAARQADVSYENAAGAMQRCRSPCPNHRTGSNKTGQALLFSQIGSEQT